MGILSNIGGKLKQSGRYVKYKYRVSKDRESLKEDILDLFDYNELKQMCSFYSVGKPDPTGYDDKMNIIHYKPNEADLKDHAMRNITLEDMEGYGKKKRKNIRPILEKKQHLTEKRMEEYPEYEQSTEIKETSDESIPEEGGDTLGIGDIIRAIQAFTPARDYKHEDGYHHELTGWLKAQFPHADIPGRTGKSLPDIIIGDVAIEVKGPTRSRDLVTVADKCARYLQHYQHLIIVLFAMEVDGERYSEWADGLKKYYKHQISIIPK